MRRCWQEGWLEVFLILSGAPFPQMSGAARKLPRPFGERGGVRGWGVGCAAGRDVRPAAQSLSFAPPKESNQRKGGPTGRVPPLRCGQPAMLGHGAALRNSLRAARCAQTTAASQSTKRACFAARPPHALRFSARPEGEGAPLRAIAALGLGAGREWCGLGGWRWSGGLDLLQSNSVDSSTARSSLTIVIPVGCRAPMPAAPTARPSLTTVIPAQAGIQGRAHRKALDEIANAVWIPAFAGMTGKVFPVAPQPRRAGTCARVALVC